MAREPGTATRYRSAIIRVLNNYQGKSLVVALDHVVATAVENAKEANVNELAEQVCQNLHEDAPKGLVCKKCFDALEAGRLPPDEEAVPTVSKEEADEEAIIARQVKMLLGDTGGDDE